MDSRFLRNFAIIAHIDHGKSTLADRFLEYTGALQAREMEAQVLDTMDLERERGITIKAHPVRLNYTARSGEKYVLNLIDTPGHVDFSYEVTRSLAACEGALLLVDASQGVEAQTLANAYLAVENNLEIIPVINKIDLPGAQPEEARRQITEIIGDTIGETAGLALERFPGFKPLKPMVFAGFYPVEGHQYPELRDALEKLRLNDASFFYEPETSMALGFGFRCGFLGLLHMEIVQERLEREFSMDLVTTAPGVLYRVTTTDGEVQEVDSPAKLPDAGRIKIIEEPVITAMILTPAEHVGGILQLCQDKRGVQKTLEYLASDRVLITYELPFNEVVLDFYDRLKTISRGYASLDYHVTGYWESPLVKMDILVNEEPVDALSIIVHRDAAYERGRALASKMRELIPRQLFEVAIQASIGNHLISRETVKALRKNVLAKCYGGDIPRKRKLLEKQKEGKKRMKRVGRVEIPQEAFLAVLKMGTENQG